MQRQKHLQGVRVVFNFFLAPSKIFNVNNNSGKTP